MQYEEEQSYSMAFEVSPVDLGSSERKEQRGSFSGTRKGLLFDLDISYTDGSVF